MNLTRTTRTAIVRDKVNPGIYAEATLYLGDNADDIINWLHHDRYETVRRTKTGIEILYMNSGGWTPVVIGDYITITHSRAVGSDLEQVMLNALPGWLARQTLTQTGLLPRGARTAAYTSRARTSRLTYAP